MNVPVMARAAAWHGPRECRAHARADVLLVSLGSTGRAARGRRGAARRARARRRARRGRRRGAAARRAHARADRPRVGARGAGARRARALAEQRPRAVLYSTTTAALLWPAPGAIRYDAPAAANRPGRHGIWQRPLERRRLRAGAAARPVGGRHARRDAARRTRRRSSSRSRSSRRLRPARGRARHRRDHLRRRTRTRRASTACSPRGPRRAARARSSSSPAPSRVPAAPGVRYAGRLPPDEYRALLRRARVFVTAPRREDYGIAQLEALADGCALVTTAAPGPYAALPLARALDPRLVVEPDAAALAAALRAALDEPAPDYAERALRGARAVPPRRRSTGRSPRSCCRGCSRPRRRGAACAAARTPPTAACWPRRPRSATRGARSRSPSA